MNILLSRYLKAGGAGWIFYLTNNFSFIVVLSGWTMENSVSFYSASKIIKDNHLTWFSIVWTLCASVVVLCGLKLYFVLDPLQLEITEKEYIFYAISYVAGIQLTNFFSALFYANRNFFLPNFLMVILNLIFIAVIATQPAADILGTHFIIKLYFSFFVVTGLALTAAFIVIKQSWTNIRLPSLTNIRLLSRYALLALAANVIFFLVYRVDYWFVKKYCSLNELGNYIQVSKLGQMLLIIPTIISSVVFPHTAAGTERHTRMKINITRIGRITTILYMILFIAVAIAGSWAFPFVFGPTFSLMHVPFLLLLPGIWALSNLYILSAYFAGLNRVKVTVQGASLALLVILAGDYLFIPRYGIRAAAIVSTIGYSANFFYSYWIFKKQDANQLVSRD